MSPNEFWAQVEARVAAGYRYGQAMFDILHGQGLIPDGFAGSLDDPYYRIKTDSSARRWAFKFVGMDQKGNLQWIPQS